MCNCNEKMARAKERELRAVHRLGHLRMNMRQIADMARIVTDMHEDDKGLCLTMLEIIELAKRPTPTMPKPEAATQLSDALELARDIATCLNGTPYKSKAVALVAILEDKPESWVQG